MLGFVGHTIDKLLAPDARSTKRASTQTLLGALEPRDPGAPVAGRASVGSSILLVLAVPVLLAAARRGRCRQRSDVKFTTRRAYDLLSTGFGPGFNGPLLLAAETHGPADLATMDRLRTAIAADPDVAQASPVDPEPERARAC